MTPFSLDVLGIAAKRKQEQTAYIPQDPRAEFLSCLRDVGFDVDHLEESINDKPVRVNSVHGKKNKPCWYNFSIVDGVGFGVYGDWRMGDDWHEFRSENHKLLSPEERRRNDEAYRIVKEARYQRKLLDQKQAAVTAQNTIASLSECGHDFAHPYLQNKNVPAYGLKTDGESLFIPVVIDGDFTSYQKIHTNGFKQFLEFGAVECGYHFIQGTTTKTYFVEGYATGASVHRATQGNVIVCFNASNLPKVIERFRQNGNQDSFIIAADNDHLTEKSGKGNAGLKYAKLACEKYPNVTMIHPENIKGSDFNDLESEQGFEALKEILTGKRNRMSILQVDQMAPVTESWFIKGILPRKKIAVAFGLSGHMKSFVAIDMALHLACGMDWHGHKVKQQQDILYICGEGASGIRNRVIAWKQEHGITKPVPFYMTSSPVLMLHREQTSMMLDALEDFMIESGMKKYPPLIIVDTLNRNFGDGDENNTKDMTGFINSLEEISAKTGCMFFIIHHSSKSDSTQARGNASLKNSSDCEYQVEMVNHEAVKEGVDSPKIQFTCTKMKDYGYPEPVLFNTKEIILGMDEDGDNVTSIVLGKSTETKQEAAQMYGLLARPIMACRTAAEKVAVCMRDALFASAVADIRHAKKNPLGFIVLQKRVVDSLFNGKCAQNGIADDSKRQGKKKAISEMIEIGALNENITKDYTLQGKTVLDILIKSAGVGI